jgi:hypothetical protein
VTRKSSYNWHLLRVLVECRELDEQQLALHEVDDLAEARAPVRVELVHAHVGLRPDLVVREVAGHHNDVELRDDGMQPTEGQERGPYLDKIDIPQLAVNVCGHATPHTKPARLCGGLHAPIHTPLSRFEPEENTEGKHDEEGFGPMEKAVIT